MEIYQPWLLSDCTVSDRLLSERSSPLSAADTDKLADTAAAAAAAEALSGTRTHAHVHQDHDVHAHHEHAHLSRAEIEANAVQSEPAARPGQAVLEALLRLAFAHGWVTRGRIRQTVEKLETAGLELPGARLVARAWVDRAFAELLLADAPVSGRSPLTPPRSTVVAHARCVPTCGVYPHVVCAHMRCVPTCGVYPHAVCTHMRCVPTAVCTHMRCVPTGGSAAARHRRLQPQRAHAADCGGKRHADAQLGRVHALLVLPRRTAWTGTGGWVGGGRGCAWWGVEAGAGRAATRGGVEPCRARRCGLAARVGAPAAATA